MFTQNSVINEMLNLAQNGGNEHVVAIYQDSLINCSEYDRQEQLENIKHEYPDLFDLYNERGSMKSFDLNSLIQLPKNTVGYIFAKHMKDNYLEDIYSNNFPIDDELNFYVFRKMQTHDIGHVITGFTTDYIGELGLGAFNMSQGVDFANFPLVIGDLLNGMMSNKMPKNIRKMNLAMQAFNEGYMMGKVAKKILTVKWEEKFDKDIDEVRKELNITPSKLGFHPDITY